jgi:hypothetical protein
MTPDVIKELVIDTPVVSVATLSLLGVPLSTWIVALTFIYVLLRLVFFVYDRWVIYKKGKVQDELES